MQLYVPLLLHHISSSCSRFSQGKLEMYVELVTATDAKKFPMDNIKPPPPAAFEVRVIVWNTRNVVNKDTVWKNRWREVDQDTVVMYKLMFYDSIFCSS